MEKLRVYGEKIEKALELYFIGDVPLRECADVDKYFYPQWLVLCDWLESKNLTPINYEKEIIDYKKLRSGSVDLVCKDDAGDIVYIEIKTRNFLLTQIKESDLLQLLFYLDTDKVKKGYVVAINRKKDKAGLLAERLFYQQDIQKYHVLYNKLILAENYYNIFFRDEVNKIYSPAQLKKDKEFKVEITDLKNIKGIYYGKK